MGRQMSDLRKIVVENLHLKAKIERLETSVSKLRNISRQQQRDGVARLHQLESQSLLRVANKFANKEKNVLDRFRVKTNEAVTKLDRVVSQFQGTRNRLGGLLRGKEWSFGRTKRTTMTLVRNYANAVRR